MKEWRIDGGFGPDHLQLVKTAKPKPGPGEVLVYMRAFSLNFRDMLVLNGLYGGKQPLPLIPLSDGAGVVEAAGEDVTEFQPGDAVTTVFHQGWQAGPPTRERLSHALGARRAQGIAAEYVLFPRTGLVKTPAFLDMSEAACLPCAGLTAWSALVSECRAEPGDTVLIQGTGGVSLFALQMAKAMGLSVLVTSSSDEKLERVKALGADMTVNYKATPDWADAARDLTNGQGVDHVIEVGGAGTLEQSLRAIRTGGRIAMIGVLSGFKTELTLPLIFMQHAHIQGITVGSRDMHLQMNKFIAQQTLHPVIDEKRFRFDDLPAAYAYMTKGEHFGKIVIELP